MDQQPKDQQAKDKRAMDNESNVPNPNHTKSGDGRPAGYKGNTEKATMDNKSNQPNPNHQPTNK